jgi:hypothetical protein
MANKSPLEFGLRRKLSRLLKQPGEMGAAVAVLKGWERNGMAPILFGGVLRDLVVLGRRHYPRDVDVVLGRGTTQDILNDFSEHQYRLNRFGGVHLSLNRWAFDVWPLERTWAFTHDSSLVPTASNLPKTTFLDVEAIAVTFNGPDRIGQITSYGFFEAIEKRSIGINYRHNPFPGLSAIRTLITACKLQFSISTELARYFVDVVADRGVAELVRAQESHYSKVIFRDSELERLTEYFTHEIHKSPDGEVSLPDRYQPKQLLLWQ